MANISRRRGRDCGPPAPATPSGRMLMSRSRCSTAFFLVMAGALALGMQVWGPRPAAAAYPERYITIICASGAGGIVDVTTRIIAEHMSRTLSRSVVVQNEPGAGTTLAIAAAAKAVPAGHPALTLVPPAPVWPHPSP